MQVHEWSGALPERATWPRHRHTPGTVHARLRQQLHRLRPTRDHEVVLDECDSRTGRSSKAAADRLLAWLAVHVASGRLSASVDAPTRGGHNRHDLLSQLVSARS